MSRRFELHGMTVEGSRLGVAPVEGGKEKSLGVEGAGGGESEKGAGKEEGAEESEEGEEGEEEARFVESEGEEEESEEDDEESEEDDEESEEEDEESVEGAVEAKKDKRIDDDDDDDDDNDDDDDGDDGDDGDDDEHRLSQKSARPLAEFRYACPGCRSPFATWDELRRHAKGRRCESEDAAEVRRAPPRRLPCNCLA